MTAANRSTSVSTVVDLVRDAAQRRPDEDVYAFVDGALAETRRVTRAALDRRARAIAARLAEYGLRGERVLLVYPPGFEFIEAFFGCIFAGVVPVPVYPPDLNRLERSLAKLRAIDADARASALLTTTEIAMLLEAFKQSEFELEERRFVTTNDVSDASAEDWRPPPLDASSLAFLQYTSGSTSSPKGVMVSHANLFHNWELQRRHLSFTSESVYVSWLPLYHDMGLIGSATQVIYSDALAVLMDPYTFLRRPAAWLEAVTRYRGTVLGAPNFAYDLCVRKVPAEAQAGLDLRSVITAIVGAEPIRAETLERFARHFGPAGFSAAAFVPSYGLAEGTLMATRASPGEGPVMRWFLRDGLSRGTAEPGGADESNTRLVSSGRQIAPEQRVLVVDPATRTACRDRAIGEIWLTGPSVAQGYWENPSATLETFHARLATGEGSFLRTGDLGFMDGGELFITGRLKDLVILNGVNHAPQDIELTVGRAHRAVRPGCVAAFAVSSDSAEQLVVVAEVDPKKLDGGVATDLRAAISAEHGIQTFAIALITPGTIPKTSSGKIQRRACRAAFLERKLELIAEDVLAPRRRASEAQELTELFIVSAPTKRLLVQHLGELHAAVRDGGARAVDIAYTLATLRPLDAVRVAFAARGRDELLAHIESARERAARFDERDGAESPGVWFGASNAKDGPSAEGPLALVFPGEGAQSLRACADLYERFPSFRASLDRLAATLDGVLERPLLDYVYPHRIGPYDTEQAMTALTRTDVCQPAIAAMSFALLAFATELGIRPAMTIGHSLGELIAAAAGGVLSPESALRFIAERGAIVQTAAPEGGAMVAVAAGRAIVEAHLSPAARVWLASFNHPTQVVIAGASADIARAREVLDIAGVRTRPLPVSHAFHSPLMLPAAEEIRASFAGLEVKAPSLPVLSCLAPGPYPNDRASIQRIFAAHATSPVDFEAGVRACAELGARVWVQVGGGSGLVKVATSALRTTSTPPAAIVTLANAEPDGGRTLCDALARLVALGVAIDARPLFAGRDARAVTLPTRPAMLFGEQAATSLPSPAEGRDTPFTVTSSIAPPTMLAISRVTGHPTSDLRLEQRLVSDLGFDSLMFAELAGSLDAAFRGRGEVPGRFASDDPSIGEVIAFLETHLDRSRPSVPGDPLPTSLTAVHTPRAPRPPSSVPVAAPAPGAPPRPAAEIGEDALSIDAFPEVKDWKTRLLLFDALRIDNPFFKVHGRVACDTSLVGESEVVNFASYNYLGLAGAPAVTRAAIAALERYGSSASASRIASGERPPHGDLERSIAQFLGCEDALVLVGGHATNVSVLGHLLGPQDLIVHDSLAHDSILGGARLSGARRRAFPHNDVEALDRLLTKERSRVRRVLIAVEGVYSMDGDVAPLAELIEVKKRHKALLYVDEAHSLGVIGATGRGIGEHAGIDRRDVELWMGTLSKSLASCGGYIAGSRSLIEFFKYSLPGFVYSVGIPPANAAAALAALEVLAAEPARVTRLQHRSRFFIEQCRARGIDIGLGGASAVVPCLVGSSLDCLRLSDALMRRGINVQPMLYPVVEEHLARLRFFVSACHSEEQLSSTAVALAEELERLGQPHRRPRGRAPSTTPTWIRTAANTTVSRPITRELPRPRKVFVTGGNGFIGSHVVRRLEGDGHTVRCLLRRTSRTGRLDGVPFERHLGDVRDLESLIAGARGCDAIVHLASVSSWADIRAHASALDDIIVGGTLNVLETARAVGIRRVVLVSSASAVNGSETPIIFDENAPFTLGGTSLDYSKAKHRAGELSRRYAEEGLEVVTVLPAEVYGPQDDSLVTAGNLIDIIRSRPAYAPNGGTSIAHVEDVADGIVAALDRGRAGERYILGGDCLSIKELMSLVLALTGRTDPVVDIPNDVLVRLCHSSAAAGLVPPISLDVLDYATRFWFVDSKKAIRELGYTPRGAEETLRPVIAWLRETRRIA